MSSENVASRFVTNGDVSIHFQTHGAGPAMIFLHGFPDNEGTFHAQVAEFSRDHLVVTPTLRGFPPSSAPAETSAYAMPVVAEDILAILDHLSLDSAVLVGHDFGGGVLQAFALAHPERVRGLALLNAPVIARFFQIINHDVSQQARSRYMLPYLEEAPELYRDLESITQHIRDAGRRTEIARYLATSKLHGMYGYYKANYPAPPYGAPMPGPDESFIYQVPALIVWGVEDPYFSLSFLDDLARWFTQSLRVVTVPKAGHWVFQDAAITVNRELRSWLENLG